VAVESVSTVSVEEEGSILMDFLPRPVFEVEAAVVVAEVVSETVVAGEASASVLATVVVVVTAAETVAAAGTRVTLVTETVRIAPGTLGVAAR